MELWLLLMHHWGHPVVVRRRRAKILIHQTAAAVAAVPTAITAPGPAAVLGKDIVVWVHPIHNLDATRHGRHSVVHWRSTCAPAAAAAHWWHRHMVVGHTTHRRRSMHMRRRVCHPRGRRMRLYTSGRCAAVVTATAAFTPAAPAAPVAAADAGHVVVHVANVEIMGITKRITDHHVFLLGSKAAIWVVVLDYFFPQIGVFTRIAAREPD